MRIVEAIADLNNAAAHLSTRWSPGKCGLPAIVRPRSRGLNTSAAWISTGKLQPLIDRSLACAYVRDTHRHVETKRARGKVILVA